jgi:hypothetical protein
MYQRLVIVAAIPLCIVDAAIAQTVSRAYSGEDGKAHVVYSNNATKTISPEKQQVGCENVSVAEDNRTVGWSVLVENCCTSYPIPMAVVVYKDGKKTVIVPPQMIFRWQFIDSGKRISILFGPVHGNATGANVYDVRSGKLAASWNGKGMAPKWAMDWQEEFDRSDEHSFIVGDKSRGY